ncbi:MAG: hypothetical protein LBN00_03790 [Oscillospiraceae bacterium]|nr:hypothetical protein [Oscillospiraceae bacterium]
MSAPAVAAREIGKRRFCVSCGHMNINKKTGCAGCATVTAGAARKYGFETVRVRLTDTCERWVYWADYNNDGRDDDVE